MEEIHCFFGLSIETKPSRVVKKNIYFSILGIYQGWDAELCFLLTARVIDRRTKIAGQPVVFVVSK